MRSVHNILNGVVVAAILLISSLASATPPAIQINQPTSTDAEELCIAINPTNPDHLAAGANISYRYRSTDAGASWIENYLTSTLGVAGDPCVAYDDDGNLFYAHLSYPFSGGSWLDRIVVQKSTDDGVTWDNGVGVGHNPPKDQDKEWLTADRTNSPYRHNLYMAWTEFDTYGSSSALDSTRILFSRSVDRGGSWVTPLRISDLGGNCQDGDRTVEGATPTVGPNGQVYMAWSGHDQIWFDRSFDGGATFGSDTIITSQPGGWDFFISGVHRCNGMPITVCDVSNSPYRGRIYVVFSDQRNGVDNTDIFLCYSDDEGSSWSAPSRVNNDTGTSHQFFPWLTVDPTTGSISIVYYDRSNTVGDATDVTVAVSNNGGASFNCIPVSESSFTPWSSVFFGDYIGIDSRDGVTYAIWMAMDGGDLSVWMAKLVNTTGIDSEPQPPVETTLVMKAPVTPTSHQTRIAFTTYHDSSVQLSIHDMRGRLIRSLVSEQRTAGQYSEMWNGNDRSGRSVASGVYLIRLQAGQDLVTRKVVITK